MPYEPWQPGMIISKSRLDSISPTWQDWTPSWSTTTGVHLPSFGNSTLSCSYAVSARTCFFRFDVLFGSSTNFGSGADAADNWEFSLPVPAAAAFNGIGFVEMQASNGARAVARIRCLNTTVFGLELSTGRPDAAPVANTGLVDSLTPWTWASGQSVRGGGQFETAA